MPRKPCTPVSIQPHVPVRSSRPCGRGIRHTVQRRKCFCRIYNPHVHSLWTDESTRPRGFPPFLSSGAMILVSHCSRLQVLAKSCGDGKSLAHQSGLPSNPRARPKVCPRHHTCNRVTPSLSLTFTRPQTSCSPRCAIPSRSATAQDRAHRGFWGSSAGRTNVLCCSSPQACTVLGGTPYLLHEIRVPHF